MLRLTESRVDDPLKSHAGADARLPRPLTLSSTQMAEEALDQAERRMENLLELVRRFDLDAPGDGPRVA